MATINGLGSTGSSGLSGYGGLASGLDRDSLIEGMTYATRAKIAAQKGKRQSVLWKQQAVQGITNKMYEFSNKFLSLSSSTSLLSGKLFSRNQITALGANSKFVSVSGSASSAEMFSILGVKTLAKNAQASSSRPVTEQVLTTGEMVNDLGTEITRDVIGGDSIYLKYGSKQYAVKLPQGGEYDYSTPEKAAMAINKALEQVEVGADQTLADVMSVTQEAGKFTFKNISSGGNALEIVGGTGNVLVDLGFLDEGESLKDLDDERKKVTADGLTAVNDAELTEKVTVASELSGKSLKFTYNGTTKTIKLGEYDSQATMDDVLANLQKGLDDAFGRGRVKADLKENSTGDKSSLTFQTITPNGEADATSIIKISGGDASLLGENGYLGIASGASNRLQLSASLKDSGLNFGSGLTMPLTISNGSDTFTLDPEKFDENSSVSSIINEINSNKDLGIHISYQESGDKFVIKSTRPGASGDIDLGGDLAKALFGEAGVDYDVQAGTDAVIRVQYAGSDEVATVVRGSNSFSLDGLNVTVNGTFGYDESGNPLKEVEAITFEAKTDTDAALKAVKEMIDEFNEILALVNGEVKQKPNRDYSPLSDEQKAEMSEQQIEEWEKKAQEGLLFGDTDLRSLTNELRFVIPADMREMFKEIGISVSTNYADNGKLVFDEEQFKEAMSLDPSKIRDALSNAGGSGAGLMTNLKTTFDKYASMTGATKGILVERAGSPHSPLSMLKNTYLSQVTEFDTYISRLNDKLKMEQDRYIKQFSSLESLVSQMNSQSSYLSQMFSM
ncbi:flagellar filament capping protein FliD [Ohessyouella blattaphilus]|uniref:Flagellar hook-associated protein 2 n=1 Tax=Ohessyouella blattaphilus TaxID=2949333 RepID=A0ABT1EF57_9FIRM|nr:flagellar filament capping protein FliD [Ohessyouella blattaphilus]MCP1109146.1 flagellar filament capping protein FliD [Ohessyouella blattaphilus]MCR8562540.1 flagellar filament capping protein FliD [Ohessyouella blattaphilus]MDL2250248.1 flagellar filament capping protein FliD [Lachnospiraceae bacterium OttesenSCG-928-J05]